VTAQWCGSPHDTTTPTTPGNYRVGDAENPEGGTAIDRDDLARFVVRATTEDRWSRRRPTLAH
jgi:hypothetical protein